MRQRIYYILIVAAFITWIILIFAKVPQFLPLWAGILLIYVPVITIFVLLGMLAWSEVKEKQEE